MSRVHVIGAGLAGLAAAVALTKAGQPVTLYESSGAAGGRCRSYHDKELDLLIDNGNHLLLSGNRSTFAYIATIGSKDRFATPGSAVLPFVDLRSGERWTLRPNPGRLPWWIMLSGRRVPDTRFSDYLDFQSVARITDDTSVADAMRRGRLYWRLIEPLAIAALNTRPQAALARLLGAVMRETLLRGGRACIPYLARAGLSEALVDPAVAWIESHGGTVQLNNRVSAFRLQDGRAVGFDTVQGPVVLDADDRVILAVPPWVAEELLPGLTVPNEFESIINIHYKLDAPADNPAAEAGFVGLLDGVAEWVFVKPGHVSVTISAANALVDEAARTLATKVWPNVHAALGLPGAAADAMPPYRVVKEKRATFVASAVQEKRRPRARTALANVVLAGDYTATGLPATIEGAIRSGQTAARLLSAKGADAQRSPRTTIMFRPDPDPDA